MLFRSEKKKSLTEDILPPLKKIVVETVENKQVLPVAIPPVNQEIKPVIKQENQPVITQENQPIAKPKFKVKSRLDSISISPILKKEVRAENAAGQAEEVNTQNEPYTAASFEKAWKSYGQLIPEIPSVVSYINNTKPAKTGEHTYQLTFSNIFQESEFKKLLPELSSHVRKALNNSSVHFITVVVETTERDKRHNPEEIFKKMSEQNPALNILKKNLNLEID